MISREIEFYCATAEKGKILTKIANALRSIPPTSVEAERAFSSGGYFVTKLRSRMNDETLSSLCMLRHFFQKYFL